MAQCTGSEFHRSGEQADDAAGVDLRGDALGSGAPLQSLVRKARGIEPSADLVAVERRPEIGAAHLVGRIGTGLDRVVLNRVDGSLLAHDPVPTEVGRTDRATGVACSRLHPDPFEDALAQQPAVGDTVEGHATGEHQVFFAGYFLSSPSDRQNDLLGDDLHRCRQIHLPLGDL